MRKGIVLVALVALLAAQADAFILQDGDLRMKLINFDASTFYAGGLGPGTGYEYVGAAACDANTVQQATNAFPLGPGQQGVTGLEDSWGILQATTIYHVADPLNPIWSAATSPYEITGVFYGLEDLYAQKDDNEAESLLLGRAMKIKLFSDAAQNFDPTGGPMARTGLDTYPTATDGTLLVEMDATPGIFWAEGPGIPAQILLDACFRAEFDFITLTGRGDMYADVVPGTGDWADATDFGMDCSLLQAIPAVGFLAPMVPIYRDNPGTKDDGADWKWHWTVEPAPPIVDPPGPQWDVLSNDPAATCAHPDIPEPATLSLLGLGLLGVARRRRRRK